MSVAAALLVLPGAEAGSLPMPLRLSPAGARVAATGPAPEQYPYRTNAAPTFDAYGFVVGQCTSFAAWWLNARGVPLAVITVGPKGAGRFLNASSWASAALSAGYQVGNRPVVGAIAHWDAHESGRRYSDDGWAQLTAGPPGHVAVVTAVLPDGQAEWVEYGWGGRAELHRGHGYAPRYLYLGVNPPPPNAAS